MRSRPRPAVGLTGWRYPSHSRSRFRAGAVKRFDELLRGDHPVGVLDDGGNLVPVNVSVHAHTEPPTVTAVRRPKEPFWLGSDQFLLHSRRRRTPQLIKPDVVLPILPVLDYLRFAAQEPRWRVVAET